MFDIATRVHNHNFRIDPIVRSLLDTDFYKILMHQFISQTPKLKNIEAEFGLKNRSTKVLLGNEIDFDELKEQLDYVRSLRFSKSELIWLQGNTFYGTRGMFTPDYIEYLRTFSLPEYVLERDGDQIALTFPGGWKDIMLWEIPALSIINELRARNKMRGMSRLQLDLMYAQAKTKAVDKLQRLKDEGVNNISDFGTRRRHSFLWQEWCVNAMAEILGDGFSGTSNVHLAMKHGFEAMGTNAHELPMVYATMAETDAELVQAPYDVLSDWQSFYKGLTVFLPDTYGTTGFLKNAPDWVADWNGCRIDSKEPFAAGCELVKFWEDHGKDPKEKLLLFSDGLSIDLILRLNRFFKGRVKLGFGWGTQFTNDFIDCQKGIGDLNLDPISLVCKITKANRKNAVKLSDNYTKATGTPEEIERYRNAFGCEGMENAPVFV